MNIIEISRLEKNISAETMGLIFGISEREYLELERECNFGVTDYLIICDILGLNFDAHL